ncbi:MAG TPA: CHAD domain-containing protein [Thermoanaerobaculia bacterium]|nr:CHAD domain-containing protein [Thermoanaerobaculia bacterium]
MTAGGRGGGETDDRRGLAHFMERVLAEREKVLAGFEPDPVHDLRVAIRRCRSLAWGMRLVDPHPGWRRLNRDGRTLFRVLGELRDTQVLMDLVRRIGPKGDPAGAALAARLRQAEARQVQTARAVLEVFPVRAWKVLAQTLHPRVRRLEPDGPFFEYLAARLLENAFAVHRRALRTRNPVVWHELRIAIKRFRYVVESFLPRRLARWERPLKSLQDLLGEVHDLHVLWGALGHLGPVFDARARSRWRRLVERGQRARMRRYRKWMTGRRAHWDVWQGDLPSRAERGRSARARLAVWFEYADPAPARTRRAAAVALRLFDQLAAAGVG